MAEIIIYCRENEITVQEVGYRICYTLKELHAMDWNGAIHFFIRIITAWKNGFAHLCKWANMYQIWYLLEGKHGEDRIYLRTWANMVFTTFASDLLSCLLHLCSLVNLSKSIFSSSVSSALKRSIVIAFLSLLVWFAYRPFSRYSCSAIQNLIISAIFKFMVLRDTLVYDSDKWSTY